MSILAACAVGVSCALLAGSLMGTLPHLRFPSTMFAPRRADNRLFGDWRVAYAPRPESVEQSDCRLEDAAGSPDVLAEKYLNGQEISVLEFTLAIRKATISLNFFGVIPGSAFKRKGVQRLLDCVVNYLPSPSDVPPMKGQNDDGEEVLGPGDSIGFKAGVENAHHLQNRSSEPAVYFDVGGRDAWDRSIFPDIGLEARTMMHVEFRPIKAPMVKDEGT